MGFFILHANGYAGAMQMLASTVTPTDKGQNVTAAVSACQLDDGR